MTPFRNAVRLAALVALLASGSANAAWNNVFQVCCDTCRSQATAAYAAPDCGQQCTTRYVQRSFYQPVTTFQQRCYYEPVTSYRTSFYWEPVTSCHVSCFFDPCTCSYKQVQTPVTSFRLRSQCCPVTSYVQKTVLQPVTSYQIAHYFEPQTTCCQTTIGAPVAALPSGAVAVPAAPAAVPAGPAAVPAAPAVPANPPTVGEQRQQPLAVPPGVSEQREPAPSNSESQRYPAPASQQPMPRAPEGASFRPTPSYSPSVRLDRIVSASGTSVQGQVVSEDRQPLANVQLLFVHADKVNTRESATADAAGKFQVTLESGAWLVYTRSNDGKTEFRKKIEVGSENPAELRLVSR
jgi:hypothetical protein